MALYNIPSHSTALPMGSYQAGHQTKFGYIYPRGLRPPLFASKHSLLPRYYPELSFMAIQKSAQEKPKQATRALDAIVQYEAKDSITFDLPNKNFNLYGVGKIGYEDMQLEAENISFNWGSNTVIATGKQTTAGTIEQKPTFTQGKTKYIAEEIRYNTDSKRGTAYKLITKQDEAIIKANKAKMDIQDTYYVDDLHFTTCNLRKPHYYIKAKNLKFIRERQAESGPFYFYFDDVPTPLGFFYGLFFIPCIKTSGLIPPRPGEDRNGFYVKDGGYYFYFNDYIDLALRGSLYFKGSSSISAQSTYKKRYGFTGQISYERQIQSNADELALQENKEKSWRFRWRHATENNRISSLTAEVDIQSKPFIRNTQDEDDKLRAETNSRIKYTNNLVGFPYNLSTSLAHSKNFQTNVSSLILPELVLTTGYIYPLKKIRKATKVWYQDIYFKHNLEAKNQLTNVIDADTLSINRNNLPKIFKGAKYGVKHTIPLETNIKVFQYFNLKPKIQYQERWYWKSIDYRYDASQDSILSNTVSGFKRVWDYNWGAALQTTLYGTHFFGSNAFIQAFRHQLEPSVGFTYIPDFSKKEFGYWQKIQTPKGEENCNKFQDFVYGSPQGSASALLEFKVDNSLDIKVKDTQDSGAKPKKIPILESFSLGSSYDFLRKNFNLNDIKLAARTRVLDNLISIEYNADFDPYIYKNKERIEEFAWQHGQGIGYVKSSSLKISTKLQSSKEKDAVKSTLPPKTDSISHPLVVDPTNYVDFDIPWQLNLTFDRFYNYDASNDKKTVNRKLSFQGDTNLTKKWKLGFNSTYDIDKNELVGSATKLAIYRDLHCWQMSFDWHPLGKTQYYEFSIGLKAAMLEDLKYPRGNEYDKL
jgi:hypothetical protein